MKTVLLVIGGIFAAFVLYAATALLGSAFHIFTLPFIQLESRVQTNEDIIKKTYNADNALSQYHYFKEQFTAIEATRNQIQIADDSIKSFEAAAGPRDKWTFEDKTEDSRLRSVRQGLQSNLENQIADYNAKAKETDRAVFKDNLPLFINL